MRMNKYLASTLFSGLFLTAAVMTPAMGQERALQPQGAWAVTKVDRSAQGGNSYCTLSRKYDENIVLSLGRNQTEEYSLAIDFQKPVFDRDKALKINLQPGPGQLRAYDMMPTSEKAVVIRLGWDTGFFDTLNNSQQMKVKIADQAYAFAMPEIAKGQGELKDCMEGLKAAAKGKDGASQTATKDVLNAEPVKASAEFEAAKTESELPTAGEINAQKQQAEAGEKGLLAAFAEGFSSKEPKLNGENEKQRKNFGKSAIDEKEEVAAAEIKAPAPPVMPQIAAKPEAELIKRPTPTKPAEAAPKLAAVNTPSPAAPVAIPSAKNAAPKAPTVEDATALEMADTSPAAAAEAAQIRDLEKRVREMSAENAALKQQIATQATVSAKPSAEVEKQISALQSEKAMLQQRLDAAKKESDAKANPADLVAMQSQMKELEIKNSQLEDSLRQSQTRIAETAINTETKSMKQIVDLQTKLEAAQKDNAELARQLESFKLQQEDGRLNTIAGDWDLEQATKRFNEAEREIRRLGLQLEQERTACNREKAQIESMLFDPAVTEQKQIERLTQLQKDLDVARSQIADNQKQIQAAVDQQVAAKTQGIEAEKVALAQQVAELQKGANNNAALVAEKTAMQSQLDSMKSALAQKDQQLASLQAQPKVDPAAMETKVAQEVGKARAAADQEISVLKAQNLAMTQNVEAMKTAMAAKDKTIADAQAAPKTDPAVLKQLADLQTSMASLKKDNDSLRDQNIVLRQESDKLHLQLADVQNNGAVRADRVASAQLEVDDLKRQLAMKDRQNATYQNQLAALQQESTHLKNRLTVANDSRSSSTDEVGALTRQVQSLQRQLSDMERAPTPQQISTDAVMNRVTPAAGYVSSAKAAPSASTLQVAATNTPATFGNGGYDQSSIQSLLQKAGVQMNRLQRSGSGFANADNFSWSGANNIRGLASVARMSGQGFENMINQYIAYQKGQCDGDFASMPSPSNGGGAKPMSLYEVACVGAGQSLSSSILFFEDQGHFIAISNQIPAADMDMAMDSRDKIASFVRGL